MHISPYLNSPWKRVFDILVCLIVLGPALLLVIPVAAAIWSFDGRPVLLWQRRVGRGRRIFVMPKLRTMRLCAGGRGKDVTRLGYFLRRYRLDELPQLFSVLTGDMSIVGPRPELVDIASSYRPRHIRRLAATPGMTGLWQVRATREEPIHNNIGYDFLYLRSASFLMDLRIILETLIFIVMPRSDQI